MATKKQHFVPRVYLKAWETQVETKNEPNKIFQGVYMFENGSIVGEGRNKDTILWEPHLYTIRFNQLYIAKKCPKIFKFYVDSVYDAMINNEPDPVYGKIGYSIIKTKESIRKHLDSIEKWDFYYINGGDAKKKSIINRINDIRCYILEDAFSVFFENNWETIRDTFIKEVKNGHPLGLGKSEYYITDKAAKEMIEIFFMMLFRNPSFNAMGIYTLIEDILKSAINESEEINEAEKIKISKEIDTMMESVWFTELYRIFFKGCGGVYHPLLNKVLEKCQIILFEANNDCEMFITSDNPAFQNKCNFLCNNENGFIFPLSPKYLLFIAKGSDDIALVDHRFANEQTVRHFNQLIKVNSNKTIVGNKKFLSSLV